MPQLGIEPLPYACEGTFACEATCEASALITEPPGPVVVEVTRMPIYTNALGLVPTQYFLLSKYLIPTLFSLFFLSVFHSIFFPPPSFSLSFLLIC